MSNPVFTDNFVGADANPIGGVYTPFTGYSAVRRLSNTAQGTVLNGNNGVYYNGSDLTSNCYAELAFGAKPLNSAGNLIVRANAANSSSYQGQFQSFGGLGSSAVAQIVATGGGISIAKFVTINAGDIGRISSQNGVHVLTVSGTPYIVWGDNTYPNGGKSGFNLIPGNTVGDTTLTNFATGTEGDSRFVQIATFGSDTSIVTASGAFGSANTAGNLLVCLVGSNIANTSLFVDDTQGNTWVKAPVIFNTIFFGWLFYAVNCKGGANTVTAHLPGPGQHIVCTTAEYNVPNAVFNQSASASGNSSTPNASVTTTKSNELLIGYIGDPAESPIAGIRGTAYRGGQLGEIRLYDNTAVSPGAVTMTAAVGDTSGSVVAQAWDMLVASFYTAPTYGRVYGIHG